MILTDREIQIALDQSLILIDPPPDQKAYNSTSVDLTLDKRLTFFKDSATSINRDIDPSAPGFDHEQVLASVTEQHEITSEGFIFRPGELILAWTTEYVELKLNSKVAARVEGKSSLARLGIGVHITAPTIHAGFKGQIRLEMVNHGKFAVKLKSGMSICQLIFEMTTGTPVAGYKGRFSGQTNSKKG